MKEFLSKNNVKYAYLDITESLLHLRNFLKIRCDRDEFKEVHAQGRVGLPCVVVNDGEKIYLDQDSINPKDLI